MAGNIKFKGIRAFDAGEYGKVHIGVLRGSKNDEKTPYLDMHPLIDEINSPGKLGVRLIRPQVADAVLTGHPDNWKFFAQHGCSIFPTSVVIAYRAPDKPLVYGYITFTRHDGYQLRYPTPPGLVPDTIALFREVATSDFQHEDKITTIRDNPCSPQASGVPVLHIPRKSGVYSRISAFFLGFGGGPTTLTAPKARYVSRDDSGNDFVTPIVRETGREGERIKWISLDCSPFEKYGLVVEIPAAAVEKFA